MTFIALPVSGAVLCGGASRRMGRDKASIRIDGVPLAERVAAVLDAGGCAEVVLVGGDEAALCESGRRWMPDRWPGAGPVGGVLTAIAESGDGGVVVAACDLLTLTPAAVTAVLTARRPDVDAVVATTTRVEPLLGWWNPRAAAAIGEQFAAGVRSMTAVLEALDVVTVSVDPDAMRNANRPADLAAVVALDRVSGLPPAPAG